MKKLRVLQNKETFPKSKTVISTKSHHLQSFFSDIILPLVLKMMTFIVGEMYNHVIAKNLTKPLQSSTRGSSEYIRDISM
ncbi:hypothetical protein MXB_176 [Myxobolus squamalis]|nr:hypothetical protein MXB_176 [Myxobolus squamalis]